MARNKHCSARQKETVKLIENQLQAADRCSRGGRWMITDREANRWPESVRFGAISWVG